MHLSNPPPLLLILFFLIRISPPLEVGCGVTPVFDDRGCVAQHGDVSLLKLHGVCAQPNVEMYSVSVKLCLDSFTWNKAKRSLCSAQALMEAQGTEQTTGDRRKCHSF